MRKNVFKRNFVKQIAVLMIVIFLAGCVPEVTVMKGDQAYIYGTEAATEAEKAVKNYACSDDVLKYAVRDLPEATQARIYQNACVEPDKGGLGKTLKVLKDEERKAIERRLTEKGLATSTASIMTRGEVLLLIGGIAVAGGIVAATAGGGGGGSGIGGGKSGVVVGGGGL